ncbi:uncharacterized protein LOC143600884 [Bidens hawaiensis]|uniref:uncharacterized protein LOC143600884 n=1 Tax=Bidens hawaiensis TaxID=980011 RepID=UPI004049EE2F
MTFTGPWKQIASVQAKFEGLGVNLTKAFKCKVRHGRNTMFWLDTWNGDESLFIQFPLLFQLEVSKNCLVSDRLTMYGGEICGTWEWSREPSSSGEIMKLRNLLLICQNVRLGVGEDQWVWLLDEPNEFSVRSLKKVLNKEIGVVGDYVIWWNNWVPKKVCILGWRAEMERLSTRFSLAKCNVAVPSIVCPICGEVEESAEHIFVSCSFAQATWQVIS